MQPPRCAHLVLLALLTLLIICLPFGHAEVNPTTALSTSAGVPPSSLSPRGVSPPLLSLAMGLAAAFALRLR